MLDQARLYTALVRSRWGVVLERTVRELQGTPCIDLEQVQQPRQEIACARSFCHAVTEFVDLSKAVTEFASRVAVKLRQQGSLAGQIVVFKRERLCRHLTTSIFCSKYWCELTAATPNTLYPRSPRTE
ncbi:hypothetical protein [Rhodoferax ferrireducens]|uniref:DinB/UmuC family translesion DNA polymerase n=1 Tax=Rhodoferax ferrireducens TaxID=192843 RepID=UPI000E0CDB27|nr:hypothetical protein [Rhodoferax ferrireducens]